MTKYLECKECTRIFSFSDQQQKAYKQHGWRDPIRCKRCQNIAKERRNDPFWGWETTMGKAVPAKKGHRRVDYPFHVVGGFR